MRLSVLIPLLLLLTYSCAQKTEPVATTPVATTSDIESFRQSGLDAPTTERTEERKTAPLDLSRMAEAFAEPKVVTPAEADAARAPPPAEITVQSSAVEEEKEEIASGDSEDANERADFRTKNRPPVAAGPVPEMEPAEKPADPPKVEAPRGATELNGGGDKSKEKAEHD